AAVKQEILNQGLDPRIATDQQKVMARLSIIMAGTTAAQGDAERSAGAFENQMKALQAVIDDTAVTVGTALLPVVTPLVVKVADAAKVVGVWVEQNQHLVKHVAYLGAGLAAVSVLLTTFAGGAMVV